MKQWIESKRGDVEFAMQLMFDLGLALGMIGGFTIAWFVR